MADAATEFDDGALPFPPDRSLTLGTRVGRRFTRDGLTDFHSGVLRSERAVRSSARLGEAASQAGHAGSSPVSRYIVTTAIAGSGSADGHRELCALLRVEPVKAK